MSFTVMRADLTSFVSGEPYTALLPGTVTNYPTLGLVQVRAVLESSSGEEGVVEFRHDSPAVTFAADNPEAIAAVDSGFFTEIRAVAIKFWELYIIATLPS